MTLHAELFEAMFRGYVANAIWQIFEENRLTDFIKIAY